MLVLLHWRSPFWWLSSQLGRSQEGIIRLVMMVHPSECLWQWRSSRLPILMLDSRVERREPVLCCHCIWELVPLSSVPTSGLLYRRSCIYDSMFCIPSSLWSWDSASVLVEWPAVMGLAVPIITVGPVVSVVLLAGLIHSGDVVLICLYTDSLNCDRWIPLVDCWIDWHARCNAWFLWLGWYCDLLELAVLRVADELFPVIIILRRSSMVMAGCFPMTSTEVIFAIYVREVAGAGLIFWYVWANRRDGKVIAGYSVRGCR